MAPPKRKISYAPKSDDSKSVADGLFNRFAPTKKPPKVAPPKAARIQSLKALELLPDNDTLRASLVRELVAKARDLGYRSGRAKGFAAGYDSGFEAGERFERSNYGQRRD